MQYPRQEYVAAAYKRFNVPTTKSSVKYGCRNETLAGTVPLSTVAWSSRLVPAGDPVRMAPCGGVVLRGKRDPARDSAGRFQRLDLDVGGRISQPKV
jgi:hypothetical protein